MAAVQHFRSLGTFHADLETRWDLRTDVEALDLEVLVDSSQKSTFRLLISNFRLLGTWKRKCGYSSNVR